MVIVGAGPAGYFAAQALQNLETPELQFSIDMIERLPTPWGLVRSGVAPDHPKIKSVSKVFEKIATTEKFRLFANIELGSDVTIAQLEEKYDAVVIATGSALGKTLGIPGEDLPGSLSAADFVPCITDIQILPIFLCPLIARMQLLLVREMLPWMLEECLHLNPVN